MTSRTGSAAVTRQYAGSGLAGPEDAPRPGDPKTDGLK